MARGPALGAAADLPRIVEAYDIGRIVVGLAYCRGQLPIDELLQAKLTGVRVEDAATTYDALPWEILVDNLKPSWLILFWMASRLTNDPVLQAAVRRDRCARRDRRRRADHAAHAGHPP